MALVVYEMNWNWKTYQLKPSSPPVSSMLRYITLFWPWDQLLQPSDLNCFTNCWLVLPIFIQLAPNTSLLLSCYCDVTVVLHMFLTIAKSSTWKQLASCKLLNSGSHHKKEEFGLHHHTGLPPVHWNLEQCMSKFYRVDWSIEWWPQMLLVLYNFFANTTRWLRTLGIGFRPTPPFLHSCIAYARSSSFGYTNASSGWSCDRQIQESSATALHRWNFVVEDL